MPKFVIDVPSPIDQLGAHERISSAIAASVTSDSRLRFVGISGRWGSGKSTVVGLLCRKLIADDPKWLVFTFDAWAHQADPARRSFLEELASLLRRKLPDFHKNHSNSHWLEKVDHLSSSFESITTDSESRLPLEAKVIVPSIILIPLGIRLIGNGVPSGAITFEWQSIVFTIGWVFCFLPFILSLILWIRAQLIGRKFSPIAILSNKVPEIRLETKTKTTEPTAIEFRQIMSGLVNGVSDADKRLLIVVDNLDRLPATEAVSLWSTIRSVLPHGGQATESGPVVVVPVDQIVLDQAFGSQMPGDLKKTDFLEKSFDVIFSVPPPVLSNWQQYIRDRLQDAVGDIWDANDISAAIDVVAQKIKDKPMDSVTPRWLNSVVNKILANLMTWHDFEFPSTTLAYFATSDDISHDNILAVVSGDQPLLEDRDPDWPEHIAALFFGVPPKDAFQILLSRPIVQAINSKRDDALVELSTSPGFGGVLVQLLRDTRLGDQRLPLLAVVTQLDRISEGDEAWVSKAWAQLDAASRTAEDFSGSARQAVVEAIEVLIRRLPEREAMSLIKREWDRLPDRADIRQSTGSKSVLGMLELLRSAAQARGMVLAPVTLKTPEALNATLASGPSDEQLALVDFGGDIPSLVEEVVSRLQGAQPSGTPEIVRALIAKFGRKIALDRILAEARIAAESGDSLRELAGLTVLVDCWGAHDAAEQSLRNLADNGTLSRIFEGAASGQNKKLALRLLAASILLGDGAEIPPNLTIGSDDLAWLNAKLSSAVGLTWERLISAYQRTPSLKPILAPMVREWLTEGGDLDGQNFLDNVSQYASLLDGDYRHVLVDAVLANDDIWNSISGANVGRIRTIFESDDDPKSIKKLAERISALADRLGPAMIRLAVIEGTSFFEMLLPAVRATGGGTVLHDNLRKIGTSELLNTSDPNLRNRWLNLCLACDTSSMKTIMDTVTDVIAAGANVQNPEQLLDVDGAAIRKFFKRRHHDGLVRHLVQQMLGYEEGRQWIQQNPAEAGKWLKGAKAETRAFVGKQLEANGLAV